MRSLLRTGGREELGSQAPAPAEAVS
jgi:hypothetical protein